MQSYRIYFTVAGGNMRPLFIGAFVIHNGGMNMSLSEELKTITSKIKKNHKIYDENEQAVRSQIIDPVLRGLGWNIEDPQDVLPNAKTGDGFPDYTLLHKGGKMLFIEAKKDRKEK